MKTHFEVLLVEDNPGDADLIQELLSGTTAARFHFSHVERLSEAAFHLKQQHAQVALLDLALPDSSGIETVRRFRQVAPTMPIVVLTGHDDETNGVTALKAGAQDYLVKGKVSADLLERVIFYAVERHQHQEALRNSELRLRAILDAQATMVIHLNPNMQVLWPNREACRVAGMTRQQIIGRPCYEIWQKHTDVCARCPVVAAIQDGQPHTDRLVTPEGRIWRLHGCPVLDDSGNIVSAVEVAEDITERISLENQLRQAQKMESLGTMAGGIAHDFNNILSAILGYTELAMDKAEVVPDVKQTIKAAYQAGLRAKDLVRQILTFSRRTEIALKPLQIGVIVEEALKLMRSILPTSIEIRQHIQENLDLVMAEPTQIHQIVMNLCTNASHAMEPDGGILEVRLEPVELPADGVQGAQGLVPGDYLRLMVKDSGCGMTPEILSSIFDPYFTTKNLGEGTGLGLSVVHGIVKECGGDVVVNSTPSKGSTFSLFFPTVEDASRADRQFGVDSLPRGTERILVVDDEPEILDVIDQILERHGYHVTVENDSLRALDLFQNDSQAFDLVLTDMTMPKMNGDRLATQMLIIRPDLPIIICSGYSRLITDLAANSGIRALLTKPVEKKTLLSEIRRVLDDAEKGENVQGTE